MTLKWTAFGLVIDFGVKLELDNDRIQNATCQSSMILRPIIGNNKNSIDSAISLYILISKETFTSIISPYHIGMSSIFQIYLHHLQQIAFKLSIKKILFRCEMFKVLLSFVY